MIILELEKEDIQYAERISELAETSIMIDSPRSFSSELSNIIQIGVELAPYAISGVTLIIIELIKNRKKIKIKITDDSVEVEGEEEKVLAVVKDLVERKQDEKAKKILNDLLSGK